jgi:hypothetical protein
MFSDEIVSCYKDTAELALFQEAETERLAPANIVVNSPNRLNIPVFKGSSQIHCCRPRSGLCHSSALLKVMICSSLDST